jgi:hypothetical protein
MDDNMSYLEANGLVVVSRAGGYKWTFAKITGEGIDVVENKERYADKFTFTQTTSSQVPAEGQTKISQKLQPKLSFPKQVSAAFKQASDQVLSSKISNGDKGKIEKQLRELEKGLLKAEKTDLATVQKEWDRLNKNAGWLNVTLAPVVLEAVKLALDLP